MKMTTAAKKTMGMVLIGVSAFVLNGSVIHAKGIHFQLPENIYILFDASGENFNCEALRKSNHSVVKHHVMQRIRQGHVKTVYAGIFSKYTTFVGSTEVRNKRGSDMIRAKHMVRKSMALIDKAYNNMGSMYSRLQGGREFPYARDVTGAIAKVINTIRRNGDKKAHIVIASTMIQSLNKKLVVKNLKEEHIKLPEGTDMIVFNKSWVCSDGAEYKKLDSMAATESFWTKVIDGKVAFDNAY